jgi:hypothetical protein
MLVCRNKAGDTLKLRGTPKASDTKPWTAKAQGGQVNSLGYGNSSDDDTMDDPQPSPFNMGKVQRLDGGGSLPSLT